MEMINNMDIMYYEFMMDLETENQKIAESLFASNYVDLLVENGVDNVIFEGNIINSIIEFIKGIFDKAVKFFKKIIDFITGKGSESNGNSLKANKVLIKKCEQKMKSMSSEDRYKFKLDKVDYTKEDDKFVKEFLNLSNGFEDLLDSVMQDLNSALKRFSTNKSNEKFLKHKNNKDQLEKEKEVTKEKQENKKEVAKDVNFNDIPNIIIGYKKADSEVNELEKLLTEKGKKMDNYKKQLDHYVFDENKIPNEHLVEFKNHINSDLTHVIDCIRWTIRCTVDKFKNQELILKLFLAFDSKK